MYELRARTAKGVEWEEALFPHAGQEARVEKTKAKPGRRINVGPPWKDNT